MIASSKAPLRRAAATPIARPQFGLGATLLLAFVAFGLNLGVALQTTTPPVMDSYEYFNGAWLLATGSGLQTPYLWNYLSDVQSLPAPAFTYWMPLPALLAAPFVWLGGPNGAVPAAQPALWVWGAVPMALLGALVPVIAALIAWKASRRAGLAWLAGGLTLGTGLYLIRWSNIDSYAPFAAATAGALCFTALGAASSQRRWAVAAGIAAALAHLTRADGLLVPLTIALWAMVRVVTGAAGDRGPQTADRSLDSQYSSRRPEDPRSATARWLGLFIVSYALALSPWLIRNLWVMGSPLGLGGTRTLWMLSYDELFSLDPDRLTATRYLASDLGVQTSAKLEALLGNLATLWVAQGQVLALPAALGAAWLWRRQPLTQLVMLYGIFALAALSLAFTYPGPRGAFLHSGGALVPFIGAGAALGADRLVAWAAARRRWSASAGPVLLGGFLVLHLSAGAALAAGRPLADTLTPIAAYLRADALLPAGAGAAVVNPPAFYFHTGRSAIVIPDGPGADLAAALDRYGLAYAIVDANHPAALDVLYAAPETVGGFRVVANLSQSGEPAIWLLERQP